MGRIKQKLIGIYEYLYEKRRILRLRTRYRLHIMPAKKTIRYILRHKCSIARYGDGEFNWIDKKGGGFQQASDELSDALRRVLSNKNKNLLICVPCFLNSLLGTKPSSKKIWIDWGREGQHEKIVEMLRAAAGKDYVFGDTQITRPYMDWSSRRHAATVFSWLRKLWDGRDLLIIEGKQTRLGIGNDLFDNARSVKRIIIPAENAFERIDDIEKLTKENYNGELILIAAGPTATVLAADLADAGMQALDVGHIDIEYEWFLRGAETKTPIPGKYVNELRRSGGNEVTECTDPGYLAQIIAEVE